MIPRDTYASIPAARSLADVPFDRWRELGADALLVGTVAEGAATRSASRCGCSASRRSRRPSTASSPRPVTNPRFFAHTIADEIHQTQLALRGVARTKLAFVSDRDGERLTGTVEIARRQGDLHLRLRRREPAARDDQPHAEHHAGLVARRPRRSPTRRTAAASPTSSSRTSTRATLENPLRSRVEENFLPAWSPDGTRLAFSRTATATPRST